jgi:hypothetical protein
MGATLTIRLSEDLAEALRRESHASGVPQGEIVRQAIAARVRGAASGSTMARHFGAMRGPADLSTNKAYRRVWRRKTSR